MSDIEQVAAAVRQPPRGRDPDAVTMSVRADGAGRLVLWLALPATVARSCGWGAGTPLGYDVLVDGRWRIRWDEHGRALRMQTAARYQVRLHAPAWVVAELRRARAAEWVPSAGVTGAIVLTLPWSAPA